MQSTILVILPTWAVFSLSLSLPLQILPKSTLSQRTVHKTQQDVLKQPEANMDFFVIFFIKALLKQISLCLLSHFRIRIIVLTCPDNKSARNHQPKSCVPTKTNHNYARPILFVMESNSVCNRIYNKILDRDFYD